MLDIKRIVESKEEVENGLLKRMKEIKLVKELNSTGFDLILLTDAGDLTLCSDENDKIDNSLPLVVIDHHDTSFDTNDNVLLINENMSSATEQVYMLLKEVFGKKFLLNEDTASLVQYGIVADTGRFLYDITTPNTHRVFAEAKGGVFVDLF